MIKNLKNLLFKNIGIRQTIFKNTFWLTLTETITRFLSLAIIIYAARILGATEYGKFTFALSFVSLFVIFGDLGLSNLTIREFSREKEKEKEYSSILSLKILLSIGALALMFIGSFFVTSDPTIQKIIWILAVFILISAFFSIIYAFLHVRQRMEYEAIAKIFQIISIAIIGFFVLFTIPSAVNLSYGYLLANLIALILIISFFHFFFHSFKLDFNKNIWKRFLKLSWPLSLGFIASWVYLNIDSIMMGYFNQITQTGWYNAASRITLAIVISGTLISRSFYPVLSKFFKESKEKLQKVWDYQMQLMIILSLPIVVGGIVFAPRIINFFYGSNYHSSILVFQILILMTGIGFLYYPYSMILVVSEQQKKSFYLILTGAVINIILNFVLIPRYSLYGAAIATVIACIIIFLAAVILTKYFTPISPFNLRLFRTLIISILASMIMFIGIRRPIIYNLNVFSAIIIGGLIYSFLLLLFFKLFFKLRKFKTIHGNLL